MAFRIESNKNPKKNESKLGDAASDTIDLHISGLSAGIVKISISNGDSPTQKKAQVIYTPDPNIATPISMLFGYHDGTNGQYKSVSMTKNKDGQWLAERVMALNESADFDLHPDVRPGELKQKPNIINKIALMDGKLLKDTYENFNLSLQEKGRLEKRVLSTSGELSKAVSGDYKLKSDEKFVEVYIPAKYNESTEHKYNLQVFLDGDMHTNEDPYGNRMDTKNILDNLIATGKMKPTIAIFTSPTPPTPEGSMPRLKEYGCDLDTDKFLSSIPSALRNAGFHVTSDPSKTSICGQSIGGLQAIYTAKMHPDIFGKVIAQSPSAWWGPSPERLRGEVLVREVRYEDDATWRAKLSEEKQQQYLLKMIQTGRDDLTGKELPKGKVDVFIQAGTLETGDRKMGVEPLKQAAIKLADALGVKCLIHDGGHVPQPWAAGLVVTLPSVHPVQEHKLVGEISEEKRVSPVISGTALTAKALDISPEKLSQTLVKDTKKEVKLASKNVSNISTNSVKAQDTEITDDQMSQSDFGQESNTAKKLRQ